MLRVKTTISFETTTGFYEQTICCHHDARVGSIVFCDEKGMVLDMAYRSLQHATKMVDAMDSLLFPFEEGALRDGIEYCENPWV